MIAAADGTIPSLRVLGIHGRLGPKQTPSCRAPVYVDEDEVPVRILGYVKNGDGWSVQVERGTRPVPPEVWDTTGTRFETPWLANLGAPVVLVLGPRELGHVGEFLVDASRCAWVGEFFAWNCSLASADALRNGIAVIARKQVVDAWNGDPRELRSVSFWLSRAALGDSDFYAAAAGLRRSGFAQWKALLDAGLAKGRAT